MRVVVIGGGPVGLVSAAVLASVSHEVTLVEIDPRRRELIAAGTPPFHEPGLEELLSSVVTSGALVTSDDIATVAATAQAIIICVGTPATGHGADLTALRAASSALGAALRGATGYRVVLVKSTVPPGTTAEIVAPILREHSGLGPDALGIGMNPEFLREGVAVDDMRSPDRVVLGITDDASRVALTALYEPFNAPLVFTTPTGAEMAKYASNALLSTLVSFSNEIAALCESVDGADADEVLRAVHADRRFRPPQSRPDAPSTITSYLLAGMGYGGSCFPKDTEALVAWAQSRGQSTPILDAVRHVNALRPERVLALLRQRIALRGAEVAVLGLTFKPDTDDLRESRSLDMIQLLQEAGAHVRAADPVAADAAREMLDNTVQVTDDYRVALQGADAMVLATAWRDYTVLDPVEVRTLMRRPLVLDARRALNRERWAGTVEFVPIGVKA